MENEERRERVKGNNNPSLEFGNEEFFDALNTEIIGEREEFQPININPNNPEPNRAKSDNNDDADLNKRITNLEKRYSSSSKESKRLAEENRVLAEENAKLKSGMNGKPPKNLKEALDLSEDFVYDAQEAIDDPESDSGKYRRAEIALEAKRILDQEKQAEKDSATTSLRQRQKQELMSKFNLDEDGWNEFQNEVKGKEWSYEDLYTMLHPELVTENAIRNLDLETSRHRGKIQNLQPSLARSGGGQRSNMDSAEDMLDEAFGIDNSIFVTKDNI